jgi:hypothetical protein
MDVIVNFCSDTDSTQSHSFEAFVELDFWECYPLGDFKQDMHKTDGERQQQG